MKIDTQRTFDEKFLQQLTLKYLNLAKAERENSAENPDGVFIVENLSATENEIISRQKELQNYGIAVQPTKIRSIKKSLFSDAMSYTGILGYYNPFTAEAQYNANQPDAVKPFTIAHETAHQLGFAREQEANFIGFLIGKDSGDNALKYSTYRFVLNQLLAFQAEKNPEFVKSVIDNFSIKMKKDHEFEKQFREKSKGAVADFFHFTNDLFLKSNRQDGVVSYSYFIDLLVNYEKNYVLKI